MFEIKYSFSNSAHFDITRADEGDLRYSLFLGNLILKTINNSIIIDWNWVPLFDFAICLVQICNKLLKEEIKKAEFEFTESDEKLIFHKNGNSVKICTTFSDEILEMTFENFQMGARDFYKAVVSEILSKNVGLKDNEVFLKYLKEAENI